MKKYEAQTPWVNPRLILGLYSDATEPNLTRNYEKFKFKNTLGYF